MNDSTEFLQLPEDNSRRLELSRAGRRGSDQGRRAREVIYRRIESHVIEEEMVVSE